MKNLNKLAPPYIDYYEAIANGKNNTYKGEPNLKKQKLLDLKDSIESEYDYYISKFTPEALHEIKDSAYDGFNKTALLNAYSGNGKSLSELKLSIKNKQPKDLQNLCPYCGILTPNSTDHYIPKDSYSEYAVLAINLVPCCTVCNGKKSEFWKVAQGRGIINFYLDTIPSDEYLICNVSFDSTPTVNYEIHNNGNISNEQFALIKSHYKRLNLLKRFADNSNDEITNTIDSIKSYADDFSSENLVQMLTKNRSKKIVRYGVNHWKCALLKGLYQCDEFIESLNT